jgi:hypothetical protein
MAKLMHNTVFSLAGKKGKGNVLNSAKHHETPSVYKAPLYIIWTILTSTYFTGQIDNKRRRTFANNVRPNLQTEL